MLKRNKKYLSIIIPILNEAKNINYLVPKISKVIKKNYKNYELIIIDDNSEDNIYDVINKYTHLNPYNYQINGENIKQESDRQK